MARRSRASLLGICIGVVFASAVAPSCKSESLAEKANSIQESPSVVRATETDQGQITAIAPFSGYREWHRTNPVPAPMDASMATLCINLSNEEVKKIRSKNPHDAVQGWMTFTVFVNDIGRARLVGGGKEEFPTGTIILKEAHNGDDPESSLMMTAMVKREDGFAPKNGNWEYFLLAGGATEVRERGSIASCVGCHRTQSDNDFVYADYIKK